MANMNEGDVQWNALPVDIIAEVFLYLSWKDRTKASQVCQTWNSISHMAHLWHSFNFKFCKKVSHFNDRLKAAESIFSLHGTDLHDVLIEMDARNPASVTATEQLLRKIIQCEVLTLRSLVIKFTNWKSSGSPKKELLNCLLDVLERQNSLEVLDLSEFNIPINDDLVKEIMKTNRNLKVLRLLNRVAMTILTPQCLLDLITNCRNLRVLSVPYVCLTPEALSAFGVEGRAKLSQLTMKCTRQDKWVAKLPDESWQELMNHNPQLHIGFHFDETTILSELEEVMLPNLRVNILSMLTYTRLHDELKSAASHYCDTLTHLDVAGQEGALFDDSLIEVANTCHQLQEVIIRCSVPRRVVEAFVKKHLIFKAAFALLVHDKNDAWHLQRITRNTPFVQEIMGAN